MANLFSYYESNEQRCSGNRRAGRIGGAVPRKRFYGGNPDTPRDTPRIPPDIPRVPPPDPPDTPRTPQGPCLPLSKPDTAP
jgi:hypothetical protein